jgi:hypothetical protein
LSDVVVVVGAFVVHLIRG